MVIMLMIGLSYASVPLYRIFCQVTGYGGTIQIDTLYAEVDNLNTSKEITVEFTSDVHSGLPWKFRPLQTEINVLPGEKALAFYEATNLSDKPIIGVATYNVTPMNAGSYFTKVQCFCFDEQLLRPHETVPMPVLFYVDPSLCEDASMSEVRKITLSYTFFNVSD